MSEPANQLHQQYQDSRGKYIYFLLTAAGACIGYAVEKVSGNPALKWNLALLAVCLTSWALSFCLGCRSIRCNEDGLHYNHMLFTAASRSPVDRLAVEALLARSFSASNTAARWQFRLFILGGVAFVAWRLIDIFSTSTGKR